MTERLDQLEASLIATANICGSNARAIAANGEGIGELKNLVMAFIQKLDDQGLQVTLLTQISDDEAGENAYAIQQTEINATRLDTNDSQIQAVIDGANADRQAVREEMAAARAQADADRQAFAAALEADRAEWRAGFAAQQEVLQRMLLEIRSTNGEVKQLGDRVSELEAS